MFVILHTTVCVGISNRLTRIWNGAVEWKMERNGECTQILPTCITGTIVQGCASCYVSRALISPQRLTSINIRCGKR